MRIAYFTETFLPKIDGIVTRLVRTLEQLADLGHEAIIFAPHRPPESYAGHRVVSVPGIAFKPWYPELILGMPRPRLGRELDRFKPDVVHIVNPVILGLWGTAITKQRNLPLLSSYHTDITQYATHLKLDFLSPLSKSFLRDVHNQAHVTLCTSQPMVNSAVGLGIKRVRLWPKAVDTGAYHPTNRDSEMRRRLSGNNPDAPLIIYVGRLSHEKRLDWLYAPVTQLPGVRLALVGSGPAETHLKARFKGTATVFTGYLSGKDLAQAYASADVFAFPSDTETLGFGAMEAMASGVPVVGARAGGLPDVIRHGSNGFMFTPGDLGELSGCLRTLLFDRRLREQFGRQGRKDMEAWGWQASTERLLEFYERARTIHRRYDPPSAYQASKGLRTWTPP
ncbi:MAG: glycosyltransferase [Deinococcota bacterium]|nr:glycosyltransferase [Deinococcota bacterium]